jgi:hypothetical protein
VLVRPDFWLEIEGFLRMITRYALASLCIAISFGRGTHAQTNVLTYHNNNLRTGWNQTETILTTKTVPSLVLQQQVTLDGQVDAQPLIVTGESIGGVPHNVVYVVTENDTVYAIDASSGTILVSQSLGTPVPATALPGGCNNNDVTVGINATPVADISSNTLYVLADTYVNGSAVYRLHALDLGTLMDTTPPAVMAPTVPVTGGGTVSFNANTQRARAALTESNGVIYAAFGSYCDYGAGTSRGWVAGWSTVSLTPLIDTHVIDDQGYNPSYFFLSSVWMSGFGPATDDQNGLFFSTGNSDPGTYNSGYNLSESVVNLSADLSTVQGYYTPIGGANGELARDRDDGDMGSGGVLLLPPQPNAAPNLAVVSSKQGPLYLLNRDAITHGAAAGPIYLGQYYSDGCWCGPSYYTGWDGIGRVVESSGSNLIIFKVLTTPAVKLARQVTATIVSGQDPGFFTSVSSNGTVKNTAVIWAVGRPVNSQPADMTLYAYSGTNLTPLFSAVAGTWPNASGANANIVPVVANGQVFVATYQSLAIFGLASGGAKSTPARVFQAPPAPRHAISAAPHEVWGRVTSIDGAILELTTATGKSVRVDTTLATKASQNVGLKIGLAADVRGDERAGTLFATAVLHAKPQPALWGTNR